MNADTLVPPLALLCFDGSADAVAAIAVAGELLDSRSAAVVTVWEPVAIWAPYDPAAALTAGVSRLASKELGLDEIASEAAHATMERGVELAHQAGFEATGRVSSGKAWRAICESADEIDAATVVLGARGLSRVQSALLGSVSAAVLAHAKRAVLVIPAHARRQKPGTSRVD
jgi:nucleotide-binding universal stress UspA family protein